MITSASAQLHWREKTHLESSRLGLEMRIAEMSLTRMPGCPVTGTCGLGSQCEEPLGVIDTALRLVPGLPFVYAFTVTSRHNTTVAETRENMEYESMASIHVQYVAMVVLRMSDRCNAARFIGKDN